MTSLFAISGQLKFGAVGVLRGKRQWIIYPLGTMNVGIVT